MSEFLGITSKIDWKHFYSPDYYQINIFVNLTLQKLLITFIFSRLVPNGKNRDQSLKTTFETCTVDFETCLVLHFRDQSHSRLVLFEICPYLRLVSSRHVDHFHHFCSPEIALKMIIIFADSTVQFQILNSTSINVI